jgi:hypothetical protein
MGWRPLCPAQVSGAEGSAAARVVIVPATEARFGFRDRTLVPFPLIRAGVAGCIGSLGILAGITEGNSPFVEKLPGAWFFGISVSSGLAVTGGTFWGVMLVYAGVALMVGSWFEIVRTLRRQPSTPLGAVAAIAAVWALPILFTPPLFSRDVYSYAAQGEMVARGINPYVHGPSALGSGRFASLVDPLWLRASAPYGPAWERLSEGVVRLAHHDVLATIVGFRLVALVGVCLIAVGIPTLARALGSDPAVALAVGVLNPLVLLVLLGGAHNDALMLGLLVVSCALAQRNHVMVALALCALAAEVKIPALIGAIFIGWWWSGADATVRRRVPRVIIAVTTAVGLTAAIGAVCGLGWRWLSDLSDPAVVVSWLDPATAVGLILGPTASLFGYPHHTPMFVNVSRAAGLGLAATISVVLVLRARRIRPLQGLGWSLLVFVVLGPVIWPWYETWGFVFLAVVAEGWTLRIVLALSAVACFADVPAARFLAPPDPVVGAICWVILVGVAVAYAALRLVPSLPRERLTGGDGLKPPIIL